MEPDICYSGDGKITERQARGVAYEMIVEADKWDRMADDTDDPRLDDLYREKSKRLREGAERIVRTRLL